MHVKSATTLCAKNRPLKMLVSRQNNRFHNRIPEPSTFLKFINKYPDPTADSHQRGTLFRSLFVISPWHWVGINLASHFTSFDCHPFLPIGFGDYSPIHVGGTNKFYFAFGQWIRFVCFPFCVEKYNVFYPLKFTLSFYFPWMWKFALALSCLRILLCIRISTQWKIVLLLWYIHLVTTWLCLLPIVIVEMRTAPLDTGWTIRVTFVLLITLGGNWFTMAVRVAPVSSAWMINLALWIHHVTR